VSTAAVFLPLVAAFIAGFFGRLIGDRAAQLVTCAARVHAGLCGNVVV
jgi:NADH-quinone oxidoreductase subunit L